MWGNVRGNEGLMQELLESAMTNTDINLKALSLRVDESSRLEEAFASQGTPTWATTRAKRTGS